jgi:capsule polysaccharide export protein KpsE/RkpR
MATREISTHERRYSEPDLDQELGPNTAKESPERRRTVAKLGLLWLKRPFLYRYIAIGFVASTIVAFLIPARYTSTTRLMPPDQGGQGMASMLATLGKAVGDSAPASGELLGLKTSADMFVGVLHSRTVQDDLINKFDLRKVYRDRHYEDARKDLDDRTDVAAERKSGIITIKVSDRSPDRAAGLGREYVEALNRIVITLNTSSAHKERVFLEERLGQVEQDLETAEKDFSQYASQHTTIDVKEQGKAMIGAAADLEGELIAAETQLEGLRQIYTSNNVRVRSVQARIDEYRRQLQKLGGEGPDKTPAVAPNGETSEQSQDGYPSIRQLPLLGVKWSDLYRRTRVQESVFETLTKQYELAKVEEARETPSVKVLDVADVPEKRSYPPRLLVILFGTALAAILASVWVLANARWQEVDPGDPGKVLAQEIFQTVESNVSGIADRVARKTESSGDRGSPDGL